MKNTVFTGALVALLSPAAAFAGGVAPVAETIPAVVAPPAPLGTDWTGFYGGAQLEYGDVSVDDDDIGADGDGVLYGLFGGYRYDFGNVVLGAELDLTEANIDIDSADGAAVGELDSVYRLGAELGYDAGPALVYATAGVARASATIEGNDFDENGFFYGLGVDYLVTDQIVVGAELLQHEFDDFDDTDLDISATTFGVSAAFRF